MARQSSLLYTVLRVARLLRVLCVYLVSCPSRLSAVRCCPLLSAARCSLSPLLLLLLLWPLRLRRTETKLTRDRTGQGKAEDNTLSERGRKEGEGRVTISGPAAFLLLVLSFLLTRASPPPPLPFVPVTQPFSSAAQRTQAAIHLRGRRVGCSSFLTHPTVRPPPRCPAVRTDRRCHGAHCSLWHGQQRRREPHRRIEWIRSIAVRRCSFLRSLCETGALCRRCFQRRCGRTGAATGARTWRTGSQPGQSNKHTPADRS
jgi:hypothetical protein